MSLGSVSSPALPEEQLHSFSSTAVTKARKLSAFNSAELFGNSSRGQKSIIKGLVELHCFWRLQGGISTSLVDPASSPHFFFFSF